MERPVGWLPSSVAITTDEVYELWSWLGSSVFLANAGGCEIQQLSQLVRRCGLTDRAAFLDALIRAPKSISRRR